MSRRTLALIAASFVALFYGVNFTIAKDVMPHYVQPFGFIVLRVVGITILFWLVSFLGPKEKIEKADIPRLVAASFFGIALNMLAFFQGLVYTTPINASVIMVVAPMVVLVLSAIFLKERVTFQKVIGIGIGLLGTVLIIMYGKGDVVSARNPLLGNTLILVNAASYACYLIIAKKIIQKYHPFTFMKWFCTIGLCFVLPFGFQQVLAMPFETIPLLGYLKIGYVVLFATFGTYILNIFAIKELKTTTVAVFIYVQPLLATVFAIAMGSDQLDGIKIIAALLIFTGVYLVTKVQTFTKA